MDQALQDLMRREVARQSRYALIAAEEIQRWLHYESESDDPSYEDAQDRLWANVQSFMGSAAMVSKLLWGAGSTDDADRRPLREAFGVTDDSALRDRELRNTFEHFDERLEAFYVDLPDHPAVDAYVGSFMGIRMRDVRSLLRGFDPITFSVTYQGKEYELAPMVSELSRLAKLGDEERQS
jgi:hypothetical protein